VHRNCFSFLAAQVSGSAAAVVGSVAVEQFAPEAVEGNSDAVRFTGYRSEIAHYENRIFRALSLAQQRDHAGRSIVTIDPLEPSRIVIQLVQRWLTPINAIQLLHPVLHAIVHAELQNVPLQAHVVSPLTDLPEFVTHEKQLLARLREHVAE